MTQDLTTACRQEKILTFHNSLINRIQLDDPAQFWIVSGWSSPAMQRSRFERLLKATSYEGGSVLDWGSGVGDFYAYLQTVGHHFTYHGLDLNPRMIAIAQSRFGPLFERVDISFRLSDSYDYVFGSGLFQFKDDEEPLYYLDILRNMYQYSRRALAVNFLSALRNACNKVEDELYLDPAKSVVDLTSLSTAWIMDHSYHPGAGDFTLALINSRVDSAWRRPSFSGETERMVTTTNLHKARTNKSALNKQIGL